MKSIVQNISSKVVYVLRTTLDILFDENSLEEERKESERRELIKRLERTPSKPPQKPQARKAALTKKPPGREL